jgi:hypothetical protein
LFILMILLIFIDIKILIQSMSLSFINKIILKINKIK